MTSSTLIVGFGNPLMSDEGIGVRVLETLQAKKDPPSNIQFLDLGTSGTALLHKMTGNKKVIIVDCAHFGAPAGTMTRFLPEEVRSAKIQTRLSLHEGNLLDTITLAKQLELCPDEIVFYGIQPEKIGWGDGLSPALEERISSYAETIEKEYKTGQPEK